MSSQTSSRTTCCLKMLFGDIFRQHDLSLDNMSCCLSVTAFLMTFPTKLTCHAILAENDILRENGRFLDAVSPILAIFRRHFSTSSHLDQNVVRNVMSSRRCRRHVLGNVMASRRCRRHVIGNVVLPRRCQQHVIEDVVSLTTCRLPRTAKIDVVHP